MTTRPPSKLRDKVRAAYLAARKGRIPVGREFAESVGCRAELLDDLLVVTLRFDSRYCFTVKKSAMHSQTKPIFTLEQPRM